jgi:cob(I)alamin adenosyltransferase
MTNKLTKGLIHVYYGDGKGKTSAALGLALRAAGSGLRVCIIQFLKKARLETGELKALSYLENIEIIQLSQAHPMFEHKKSDKNTIRMTTAEGIELAYKKMHEEKKDVIILDEILNAAAEKYISDAEILKLLKNKDKRTEIVLTGRTYTKTVAETADYVSEIKSRKHPYKKGVQARKGIEF